MNLLKNPVLSVVGILALAILLLVGCSKKPSAPNADLPPITRITTYGISTAPDSAALYNVTVYWGASDPDGQAEYFRYWVDQADLPNDQKTSTFETNITLRMLFDSGTPSHTFYVQARDNRNVWDPSPASIDINIADVRNVDGFLPSTLPVTVPPNGSLTSRGVFCVINGTDLDGAVTSFQWAVDDTSTWHQLNPTLVLATSSTLELRLTDAELSLGPHTILVRAIDNFGNVDDTPLSMSIECLGTFAPELALSVRNGESFVVPFTTPTMAELQINVTATVDFYYSAIRDFYVYTSTGFADTTTDAFFTLTDVGGGDYWVKVVANDIGGNTAVDSTNFSIVVLQAHNGILGINGVDWASYGSQITNIWSNAVPFGNFPHFKWWDVFLVPPGGGRPIPDSVLGTGSVPDWMFDTTYFAAIVWFANEFSGDEVFWNDRQTEIMNYLNNGGNLILATRFGADFFFPELDAFAGTSPDAWTVGINPPALVAVGDSLTNINRLSGQSQSLTDIPAVSGGSTRVLYEVAANAGYAGGFIAEPAGKGKFVFIAGRNYRWVNADLKANFDVIYRYYFGMRDQYLD